MTVYVDDMQAQYGRMKMCHMIADTDEELHAMADLIGIARKWWQSPAKTRCVKENALQLHVSRSGGRSSNGTAAM